VPTAGIQLSDVVEAGTLLEHEPEHLVRVGDVRGIGSGSLADG
jgi:hypothetical protein